jgi:hypothetical protein
VDDFPFGRVKHEKARLIRRGERDEYRVKLTIGTYI